MPTRRRPTGKPERSYRGQNANMHACEAMLAAHAATGEARSTCDRALDAGHDPSRNARLRLADGLRLGALPRPTGRPTGTTTATTRPTSSGPGASRPATSPNGPSCCCMLEAHRPADEAAPAWLVPDGAPTSSTPPFSHGWDDVPTAAWSTASAPGRRGLRRATGTSGSRPKASPPPRWLAVRSNDETYWRWYDRLWAYAWTHFDRPSSTAPGTASCTPDNHA